MSPSKGGWYAEEEKEEEILMVGQPVYFTNPNAFLPPEQRQQTLAEQLAGQGFLSPGVEAPGGQMFYNVAPEMRDLIGGIPDHMYAGESITPEFMRYMAQSWAGGQKSSRSPDQLRKMFPSYLHQFMPQLDPRTRVSYTQGRREYSGGKLEDDPNFKGSGIKTAKAGFKGSDIGQPYMLPQDWGTLVEDTPSYYSYSFKPIAAPQFQELPSADIQQQISKQAEMEYERDRRPLLRSGAGRNVFGTGRT